MADERLQVRGRVRRGELDLAIDLDLPRGVIAVVGPNGSGKSSLLRVIAGLDALTEGEVRLEGRVLDASQLGVFMPPEDRDVALAFQEARLFPHRTVLANIAYPLERRRMPNAEVRAVAVEMAARVGMGSMHERRPSDLSGGQAQRVALARAMAPQANTLLLDEPLAAIDESSSDDLRALILRCGSERVVWVTHDPADAARADLVVSIVDGRIEQTAS